MKTHLAAFALFTASIPAANWTLEHVGLVWTPEGVGLLPVAPGLWAPSAAVLMVGPALVLRDWLHECGGRGLVLLAILVGAVLSAEISLPALALASAVSFLIAELADFAVYDRLRQEGRARAVVLSGMVAAPLDSILFLTLAGMPLSLAAGMTLGKFYASALAGVAIASLRAARRSV